MILKQLIENSMETTKSANIRNILQWCIIWKMLVTFSSLFSIHFNWNWMLFFWSFAFSVTSIGGGSFYGCFLLMQITFSSSKCTAELELDKNVEINKIWPTAKKKKKMMFNSLKKKIKQISIVQLRVIVIACIWL